MAAIAPDNQIIPSFSPSVPKRFDEAIDRLNVAVNLGDKYQDRIMEEPVFAPSSDTPALREVFARFESDAE